MMTKQPVHLKEKVASTASNLKYQAHLAKCRAQSGLEEFGEDVVAKAAQIAGKLEDATDHLAGDLRDKVIRNQNDDHQ